MSSYQSSSSNNNNNNINNHNNNNNHHNHIHNTNSSGSGSGSLSAASAAAAAAAAADSKKEEFRRYLERTNVMDTLTKVLVGLYEEPERPSNAMEYIRKYIGAPPNVDIDSLRNENQALQDKVERLTEELKRALE